MSIYDEDLWNLMESMATEDGLHEFVAGVREVCEFGLARAKTIRDTFPLYTLHDETHICNVLRLMRELLGVHVSRLTRDEAATLVMCACCHDVGMSYAEHEKRELLEDFDRIDEYLDRHPKDYVRAYAAGLDKPVLDDDMQRSFFRSIHHERVQDLLGAMTWPRALVGKVDRDVVVRVCRSHGNDVATLGDLDPTPTVDLRMCAVLLRLADILDFDDSRAPKPIYEYCELNARTDVESTVSAMEWRKHLSSAGFIFPPEAEREHSYDLVYAASCNDPQVEQGVRGYLDWVDEELRECAHELGRFRGTWQDLALPQKVQRNIESFGYESEPYRLVLDQDKVLDLLVGNNLYADQSVFVRELIQNAIDAVRTRQELDKNPRRPWKPQISIRTWTDDEGYHWFRIEDNGVGMTKQTMLEHLLKVGSSYYSSDAFRREKLRHNANSDYTPISRFGIGILSCFMDGNGSARVEINTKHYEAGTSLRLRLDGTSGFYRLCNRDKGHRPGPMQGITNSERREYLSRPGTAIAVRTNLYTSGTYGGFKEIVDKYVAFPPVPIHYEGEEGSYDYPTEQKLVAGVCGMGPVGASPAADVIDLPIPAGAVEQIQRVWPEFSWPQDFKVQLGRLSLGAYAESPHVAGAAVVARTIGDFPTFTHRFGTHEVKMQARAYLDPVTPYAENSPTIRLGIIVRPTGMDGNAINRITSKYKKFVYSDDIIAQYTQRGDFCLAGILDALRNPSTLDGSWRTTIRERFGLTDDELDQEVERARDIIGLRTGLEPREIDLALHLSKEREWHVAVCDLSSLDWYATWFGGSCTRTGHRMLVAHNGIACGSAASLFCDKDNGSRCVAAVLLLKDKLRPNLGLARDGIRSYTIETQLVLELMRRRIQADGYYLGEDFPTRSIDYHLLEAAAYEDVLAHNKALAHDLTLAVNGDEQVRIDELFSARQSHKLVLQSAPVLMWDDFSGVLTQRYQRFCLAYAQQLFTIRAPFNRSDRSGWMGSIKTQLFPKGANDLPQGYRLFPPAFFVLPLSPEDTCLTTRDAGRRRWVNAEHPLATFLLQNAVTLRGRTPGILAEFTRCLAEDDGVDLVRTANRLLDRLRALRSDALSVPADLKLTTDDLC